MRTITFLFLINLCFILSAQDFRKVNWGTSAEDIRAKETATYKNAESNNDLLVYDAELGGKKVQVNYMLISNKLVRAKYIFKEVHTSNNKYYDDYLHFKNLLTKKYGKPDNTKQKWVNDRYKQDIGYIGNALSLGHVVFVDSWEKDNTEIVHAIFGKAKKINHVIEYASTKYRYLEKQKKDDAVMDDL